MNSLGLDGDDSVELADELEAIFAFKFGPGEAEAIRNVGDIHDFLSRRFSSGFESNNRCATAMTFYRLRRALCEQADAAAITPSTDLGSMAKRPLKLWRSRLEARSGLRLPPLALTPIGWAGVALIVLATLFFVPFALLHLNGWPLLGSAALGALLFWRDPRRMSPKYRLMSNFTSKTAAMNYGRLVEQGASTDSKRLWDALVALLSERSNMTPEAIGRETTILRSQSV
jgi:hypothetical protein